MTLLTDAQREQLLSNGSEANRTKDHFPVVKLFTPDAGAVWLLTELDPAEPSIAYGLCDLGLGFPELGYVSITELAEVRGPMGFPVEDDFGFTPKYPISIYARAASAARRITENAQILEHAADEEISVAPQIRRGGPQP